jgi:hypothetical protein
MSFIVGKTKKSKNSDVYYTIFYDAQTTQQRYEYNIKNATSDINLINERLKVYNGASTFTSGHDTSLSKEEMQKISDIIIFPEHLKA